MGRARQFETLAFIGAKVEASTLARIDEEIERMEWPAGMMRTRGGAVRQLVLEALVAREQKRAAARPRALVDQVLAELPRHVRASVGLVFVPSAVRALEAHGVEAVQAALLAAHRAGRIELQPEGGLNRLSREELALCPPGPQGTRLSWARLLERKE